MSEEKEEPINGGHRFALQSSSDVYSWADAVQMDPLTGEPIWYCVREGYCELKRKLPGWGILVDIQPPMTLEEFKRGKTS